MRKVSSIAVIANYGESTSRIHSAIRHVLGGRSVVIKFTPPMIALDRLGSLDCDIAVLDWCVGLQSARRIIAGVKSVAPHCVVVAYSRTSLRRDQTRQAGADLCVRNKDFGSLCEALEKAIRARR